MKHSHYIYIELKEVTPFLAEMEKTNVFSVPENYFSGLHEQILQMINSDSVYTLPTSETHFFSVPEGYFDSLPLTILGKIKSLQIDEAIEETEEFSPLLSSLKSKNVFDIPKGYFETLPQTIFKASQPPVAKVVVIKKRSMVWNLAAAAMLTGFMAISALWISNKSNLQLPAAVTASITAFPGATNQYKSEQLLNEGIANLADDDIIKYLETTGTNDDDDALATSINEKELPSEQDYLLNDKTLNTYLNEIEKNN